MILSAMLSLAFCGQAILPGSDLTLEKAREKAHIIAVGKVTTMGEIIGAGAVSFGSLELEHSEVLKGAIKEKVLKRLAYSARGHEASPTRGEGYLFFVEQYEDRVAIVKMLPRTKENIEAARKEIKD